MEEHRTLSRTATELTEAMLAAYDAQDWELLTTLSRPLVILVVNRWNYHPLVYQNEDLVQTILLKIWRYIPNLKLNPSSNNSRGEALRNIIYKLAKNQIQFPEKRRSNRLLDTQQRTQSDTNLQYEHEEYTEPIYDPYQKLELNLHLIDLMTQIINNTQKHFTKRDQLIARRIKHDLQSGHLDFQAGALYLKAYVQGQGRWSGFIERVQKHLKPITLT